MGTDHRLTKNERLVLSLLSGNARLTDTEIGAKIHITPQAVRKIRKKLENDYINEYRTIVDYEKIGITVFAILQLKVKDHKILENKNIIGAFEVNESNISHILIMGFPSLENLDDYKSKIVGIAEIQKINIVSKKGFLKKTPVELIKKQLDNKWTDI